MNPPDEIRITAEPTADPAVCRFRINRTLHAAGGTRCADPARAAGSPLFEQLFAVAGVREVAVLGSLVTVVQAGTEPWQALGPRIGAAIRAAVRAAEAAGRPLIDVPAAPAPAGEEQLRERLQRLFEQQINPALAAHGGHVALAGLRGTEALVVLGGGCQGCASAQATLRLGIERAVRQHVPEITAVVDVTDHDAGVNPYYS